MKLIIASNNAHKIYEIKKILSGKFEEILSLREAGVKHETVEDGSTFMENSLKRRGKFLRLQAAQLLQTTVVFALMRLTVRRVFTARDLRVNIKGRKATMQITLFFLKSFPIRMIKPPIIPARWLLFIPTVGK